MSPQTAILSPSETKARAIAAELGLAVKIAWKGAGKCPKWAAARPDPVGNTFEERIGARLEGVAGALKRLKAGACQKCGEIHGDHYRVTLRVRCREHAGKCLCATKGLSFDFWGSRADQGKGERPGWYDILACVSSDASTSTDPDEVARDMGGDMRPSQAIACAKWAARLQAFFTAGELARLAEVDQ